MESLQPSKKKKPEGIALFMVMSAMTVLSLLVTEFVYTAQVNRHMAYDGLDQIRGLYIAKSGFKISLLRLKAYQLLAGLGKNNSGGAPPIKIPKQALEQVWKMPFIFPIPELPTMTMTQKDALKKFTDESGISGGSFTALIESDSSRFNLNAILKEYSATVTAPPPANNNNNNSNSGNNSSGGSQPNNTSGNPGGQQQNTFDPAAVRDSLTQILSQLLREKMENDEDFAAEYRDFILDDFTNNLFSWIDRTFQGKGYGTKEVFRPKQAPMYSLSELRLIPPLDDTLFDLFAPALTVSHTNGVNVNTIPKSTFKALFGTRAKVEEVDEFYKYRDSEEEDHLFADEKAFWDYVKTNFSSFSGDQTKIDDFKTELAKRNIQILTDESIFKITVYAFVNQSTRVLEANVQLVSKQNNQPQSQPQQPQQPGQNPNQPPNNQNQPPQNDPKNDTGLKITFLRII